MSFVAVTDFSRKDYDGPPMTDLVDIINYVKPTALLGLSTIKVRFISVLLIGSVLNLNLSFSRVLSTNL